MKQLECKIIKNNKIAPRFYKIRIESSYLAKNSKPGQFVEVRCSGSIEPLLRRPLGVHRILKNGIEMLYEVVGRGTEILSRRKSGETLDTIGPLGNGFTLRPRVPNLRYILIAGGVGVAPLFALAEQLAYSGQRIAYSRKQKIHVFIGACKKEHVLCEKEFKKLNCEVTITTDDGSKGKKGFVSEALSTFLNAIRYTLNAAIYACGPTGMLKAVSKIAESKSIACQVLLEEHMACGVGVCLGCPVKLKSGENRMVCKDGPVFNAGDIAW